MFDNFSFKDVPDTDTAKPPETPEEKEEREKKEAERMKELSDIDIKSGDYQVGSTINLIFRPLIALTA
jgi:hypothetical protein